MSTKKKKLGNIAPVAAWVEPAEPFAPTFPEIRKFAATLQIVAVDGPQSPANVRGLVETIRWRHEAEITRDALRVAYGDAGLETVDIAIGYLCSVFGFGLRRGTYEHNDVLLRPPGQPAAPAVAAPADPQAEAAPPREPVEPKRKPDIPPENLQAAGFLEAVYAERCATCRSEAGEPCETPLGGFRAVPSEYVHRQRVEAAAAKLPALAEWLGMKPQAEALSAPTVPHGAWVRVVHKGAADGPAHTMLADSEVTAVCGLSISAEHHVLAGSQVRDCRNCARMREAATSPGQRVDASYVVLEAEPQPEARPSGAPAPPEPQPEARAQKPGPDIGPRKLATAGHLDAVHAEHCEECGMFPPTPCVDGLGNARTNVHRKRIDTAAAKHPGLRRWLDTTEVSTDELYALIKEKPGATGELAERAGAGVSASAVAERMAPLIERGAVKKQTGGAWAVPDTQQRAKLPPAILQKLKPRTERIGAITFRDADNVRGGELVKLATARPAEGTTEYEVLSLELDDLITSIPDVGLLEPPVCALESDESLTMVAGYRRSATVILLYGTDAEITVMAGPLTPAERRLVNLAENTGRREVVLWRVIDRCYESKEVDKTPTVDIARAAGFSVPYTENLIRLRRKLSPEVWAAWCASRCAIGVDRMIALCPHPAEEQWRKWQELLGINDPGKSKREGEGEEGDGDAPDSEPQPEAPPPIMTKAQIWNLLGQVRGTVPPSTWLEGKAYLAGARAALEAVVGAKAWKLPKAPTAKPKTKPGKKRPPKLTKLAKKTAATVAAKKKTQQKRRR